jgi:hypothetical protein
MFTLILHHLWLKRVTLIITKTDGYQKMCDTNKNVIKMVVIIKGGLKYCAMPFISKESYTKILAQSHFTTPSWHKLY